MAGKHLPRKPILSDEAEALIAFAIGRGLNHYFCYFHLVYKWRPYRVLQLMASRALRIPTPQQFEIEIIEITIQLELLRTNSVVPEHLVFRFAQFLGYRDYEHDRVARDVFPHGIWLRIDFGMPTANTHDERFHRTINGRIKGKGQESLVPHLQVIREAIEEKQDQFLKGNRAQLRRVLRDLTARATRADDVPDCTRVNCGFYRDLWKTKFHLTDIPCKHQVHDLAVKDILPKLVPVGPYPPHIEFQDFHEPPHTEPVEPWPFAKPRTGGQFPPSAGLPIPVRETLHIVADNEMEFLIGVMRDVARLKAGRGCDKLTLMLTMAQSWNSMAVDGYPSPVHRRAAFWFDCVINAQGTPASARLSRNGRTGGDHRAALHRLAQWHHLDLFTFRM
jgi:hypothetical protein